jgi:hypothetical protein
MLASLKWTQKIPKDGKHYSQVTYELLFHLPTESSVREKHFQIWQGRATISNITHQPIASSFSWLRISLGNVVLASDPGDPDWLLGSAQLHGLCRQKG